MNDLIYSYTRAEALADGVLIDVSTIARELGFHCSVAVTAALWADIQAIPESEQGTQSSTGRLWDVLWLAALAAMRATPDQSECCYGLTMAVNGAESAHYTVKMIAGPGDRGEQVLTLMLPDED